MLEFSFDVLLGYILAHVEGTLAGAGVTLSADVLAGIFLFLILIKTLGSGNGQITVSRATLISSFVKPGRSSSSS